MTLIKRCQQANIFIRIQTFKALILHPSQLGVVCQPSGHAMGSYDNRCSATGWSSFPALTPEFQRLFPDEAAWASYLERSRWKMDLFAPTAMRPAILIDLPIVLASFVAVIANIIRIWRRERSWNVATHRWWCGFGRLIWSPVRLQVCQLCSSRDSLDFRATRPPSKYSTSSVLAWCAESGSDWRTPGEHVEVDETLVGGRTRGKVAVFTTSLSWLPPLKYVSASRHPNSISEKMAATPGASACPGARSKRWITLRFVKNVIIPARRLLPTIGADTQASPAGLYAYACRGTRDTQVAEEFLPIIHLVFANLKTWLLGIHHGVSQQHLASVSQWVHFRFNRRFYPFNAFRSLLGIASDAGAPTYGELYSGEWKHPTCSGLGR